MLTEFKRLPKRCGKCHAVLRCVVHHEEHPDLRVTAECRLSCVCVQLPEAKTRSRRKKAA